MWVLILCLVLTLLLTVYVVSTGKNKAIDKLPGPSTIQIIKFLLSTPTHEDLLNKALELNKTYGAVVKIWVKPFKPVIMISDPDSIKQILMSKDNLQKPNYLRYYEPYVGDALSLITSVPKWKHMRKLTSHGLNQNYLQRTLDVSEVNLNDAICRIKPNHEVPMNIELLMHDLLQHVSFEALKHPSVDIDQNLITNFFEARDKFMILAIEKMNSLYMDYDFIYKHTKNFRETQHASKHLRALPTYLVKEHKKEDIGNKENFISGMIAQGMSDDAIRDMINVLIEAGLDTTASSISFTIYELSKRKDIQDKILQETIDILGTNPDIKITFNDLQKLKYLTCVVKETLRYYTIFDLTQRVLGAPTQINDVEVPAGTTVIFLAQAMHMSQKYFDNPTHFNPDRFLPENESKLNYNAYLPFLSGPRDCIGKTIAMNLALYNLAKLVRTFEITSVDQAMGIKFVPTRKSINGIFVKLKERTSL